MSQHTFIWNEDSKIRLWNVHIKYSGGRYQLRLIEMRDFQKSVKLQMCVASIRRYRIY